VAPMLVQPIVENAINHGLAPKTVKGTLSIQFKMSSDEGELICIVEDDGVGRKQAMSAKSKSHNSISTEVNEARLKLINEQQKLKDKYRINIEDKFNELNMPSGTRVSIHLATATAIMRNEVRGNG
jgi:LytS/YehU family sensor histidine kinase